MINSTFRLRWRCAKAITIDNANMGKSLFALFSDISDYRCLRRSNYELAFMLTTLVIAFLAGHTSTYQAVTWMHTPAALAVFAGFDILFSKGHVPSYDTYARMLRKLDHEELALEFTNWMNCILLPANIHMAIDGKGLVGATERIKGKKTPYVLNVVETTTGLTIASIPIQEKTNEIKAIPEILAWVTICSNMISIDAIGTQAEIIQTILKEQGDFLLLVKRNNPEAYDSIIKYFESTRSDYEATKRKNASKGQPGTPDSEMTDESSFKNFQFGEWHCE